MADNLWIDKAHKYIKEHRAFTNVSDVYREQNNSFIINADLLVGLPARYLEIGITESGVKSIERISLIFDEEFPLKAPKIILRDDFPRSFPHINPSLDKVIPCIYEGDLSELLQQSAWLNGLLNQLVDWMEKAASGSLMNYKQGWEPMRNDKLDGFIIYDKDVTLEFIKDNHIGSNEIYYEQRKGIILTNELCNYNARIKSTVFICRSRNVRTIDKYCPNKIKTIADLYQYAQDIGIDDLKDKVEKYDLEHINEDKLFILLAIKRPIKLIRSNSDIELLNFIVYKASPRKGKKRVLPNCKVGMLEHINKATPALLKQLSGTKQNLDQQKDIALLGCGSLGSKIGLHLARSGNGPFMCIDPDLFLPHNNARHGFSIPYAINKADLLHLAISLISSTPAKTHKLSGTYADYSKCRAILDSTASLSVRSFLMGNRDLPPIISCMLFGNGALGVTLVEGQDRITTLSDLWAYLYLCTMEIDWLQSILFSEQHSAIMIGQSCSSFTVIMSDANLSLYASTMALRIQQVMEEGFPPSGEIMLSKVSDQYSLSSEIINISKYHEIPAIIPKHWRLRVSSDVIKKMEIQAMAAGESETGGCLIGSIFLNANLIVVTDILPPPPDSQCSPLIFILGTVGLEEKIKSIERKTHGKVTYLGTWHSHPHGGSASDTDKKTAIKLLFVRDYEPTVCLIWTPNELIQI
ncbi:MAG: Mov34/MPN/PAD-1 family protein [Deltaproteobacteria bacterium]